MNINPTNMQTLYHAYNAAFQEGFGQAAAVHMPLTLETTSATKVEEYGWLGHWPDLEEWVGERVYKGIEAHGYSIRNKKFQSSVRVSRDDIEDDRYGIWTPRFKMMGDAAARHPCKMVFGALKDAFAGVCYDGQYFFDTDHPVGGASVSNSGGGAGAMWVLADCSRMIKPIIFQRRRDYAMRYMDALDDEQVFERDEFRYGVDARVSVGYGLWQLAYGSKQPLTVDNYSAAFQALESMTSDEGTPLGITPTHLFVTPSNRAAALELINAERNAAGATNVWRGTATLEVTRWLGA